MKKQAVPADPVRVRDGRMTFRMSTPGRFIFLLFAVILSVSFGGCSNQTSNGKQSRPVKLGTLTLMAPFVTALKDELVAKGYKAEVVLFDANNMAAIAAKDGDIDGFMHNHVVWIDVFNKEHNSRLTMVKPYLGYYRFALYSVKHKSLDQLPKGAKIAIGNDPSNLENGLLMLQELKLLSLKPKTTNFYTVLDIKENPKDIKVIETEGSTTVRSIKDADAVICAATRLKMAGMDPNAFLAEDKASKGLAVGLTVDAKSVEEPWVKDAMKILASDEMRAKFDSIFGGTIVLYPK